MKNYILKKLSYLVYAYLENLPSKPDIEYYNLYEEIQNCSKCPLHKTQNNVVVGEGPIPSDILIIGEAPGYYEDISGKPFVGKAGELLTKMLKAINISREDVYITNVIKCRPPDNRDPESGEIEACMPFLLKQIDILKPKIILTLGNFAAKTILKTEKGISKIRGKIYNYNDIPLVPTYHPAALLRNENLKKEAWYDLKLFRNKLREL